MQTLENWSTLARQRHGQLVSGYRASFNFEHWISMHIRTLV